MHFDRQSHRDGPKDLHITCSSALSDLGKKHEACHQQKLGGDSRSNGVEESQSSPARVVTVAGRHGELRVVLQQVALFFPDCSISQQSLRCSGMLALTPDPLHEDCLMEVLKLHGSSFVSSIIRYFELIKRMLFK